MNNGYPVIILSKDSTKIIPCRQGDVFFWNKNISSMWEVEANYRTVDLWVLNDGEQVLLTNRLEDVPEYIEIIPQEVGGMNVRKMVKRLNSGYSPGTVGVPLDALESAWRIGVGDYVIWSGPRRQGEPSFGSILGIFLFQAGTLAISSSEHIYSNNEDSLTLSLSEQSLEEIKDAAVYIERQGIDRRRSLKWKLG